MSRVTTRHEDWGVEAADWLADTDATVVAVDGSSRDASVLHWAATEATRSGSELVIVTVVDEGVLVSPSASLARGKPRADELLEEAAARVAPIVAPDRAHGVVLAGDAATEITRRFAQARLVVIGRRGLDALERMLVGSTSLAVAARSSAPVVVVPDRWDPKTTGRRPVVVGVDPAERPEALLTCAGRRAERLGVPLVAVHALDRHRFGGTHPGSGEPHQNEMHAGFDALMERWSGTMPSVALRPVRTEAAPASALLDWSSEAQLVVVGRRIPVLPGVMLSTTLRALLHYADCPVMVVPDTREGGDGDE